MKKTGIILLLLTFSLFADIAWQKDLSTAFSMAQKEHKNVMVFVEGAHCRWCKKMKHRTLSEKSVETVLKPYVTVKVAEEDSAAMKMLPAIDGVPTMFFMSADKKVLSKVAGYYAEEEFTAMVKEITSVSAKVK